MTKELCSCGKTSVWCYLPGYSAGDSSYHCDDCVPRGCECNYDYTNTDLYDSKKPEGEENVDWKWIEEGICWTQIDSRKREYPCSEYEFDPDGFERAINPHIYEK